MPGGFEEPCLGDVVSDVLGAGVCNSWGVGPQDIFEAGAMLIKKLTDGLARDVVWVEDKTEKEASFVGSLVRLGRV